MNTNFNHIKRLVTKVDSSSITHETREISLEKVGQLARECANLRNKGIGVALVSSGAIFAGAHRMLLSKKPRDTPRKQAASAVGQVALMNTYARSFHNYNYQVAQLLLTRMIEENTAMGVSVKNAFDKLFNLNVVPIINENNAILTLETEFEDSDKLSTMVARIIQADLLILLSDIDGLCNSNPRTNPQAKRLSLVEKMDEGLYKMAGNAISSAGIGGMVAKLDVAKLCMERGIDMVIVSSQDLLVIRKIIAGEDIGTLFVGGKNAGPV